MKYEVCQKCYAVYDSTMLRYHSCPRADCDGDLVELDEEMILPIFALWRKGYKTMNSCSGHIYDEPDCGGYIMFSRKTTPESCPEGWYIDDDCIRYRYPKRANAIEMRNTIRDKIDKLCLWIAALDIIPESVDDRS